MYRTGHQTGPGTAIDAPARIADLSLDDIRARLSGEGLFFRAGPFVKRVRSDVRILPEWINRLYGAYPLETTDAVADYLVEVRYTTFLRSLMRRQIIADIHQPTPMVPMAEAHAPLMLEMGLNWSHATRNAWSLVFHAGVVEKGGRAVVIPGMSGHGKSTLSAGLALSGWRYFSDEFALIDLETREVIPYPRPVSLKNESIDVIRQFAPDAVVTEALTGTHKGNVAYIPPREDWIGRMGERAPVGAVIFPNYDPDSTPATSVIGAPEAFMLSTVSSVNYDRFGARSFNALSWLMDNVKVYSITYPDLASGIALVDDIAASWSPAETPLAGDAC